MHRESSDDEALIRQAEAIEAAVQAAVREALLDHKRAGNPVVIWENGGLRWLQPDEIDVDDIDQSSPDEIQG